MNPLSGKSEGDETDVTYVPISGAASGDCEVTGTESLRIPGYRVIREIARGGMGRVIAAVDLSLERDVAIKTLLPGANPDRFVRESKITARLPHPGIPPVYALGCLEDGSPFLSMKLVAGRTLAEEITAAERPQLLQSFAQICQAVGFAHNRGVIHRDLKPANVMVGAFGEVQVMDWGLARYLPVPDSSLEAGSLSKADAIDEWDSEFSEAHNESVNEAGDHTQAGMIMGTPAYMAPEQARGEATDTRADVFSLGGILCTILTKQPPFVGNSSLEVIQRAGTGDLAETFARLESCGADCELVALTKGCLAFNAVDRPKNAQTLAGEITRYLNGVQEKLQAIERDRVVSAAKEAEMRKRRRIQWAFAAAVVTGLMITAGLMYRNHLAERDRISQVAKLEETRLTERREAALEKAILASRMEDFDGTRAAIREAEKLGCSAGEVRMLQGQLELYQGNATEAIDHLTQAAELRPDSVAARSMLALACLKSGRTAEHYRALREASRLIPITPDDFLFLGHAQSSNDSLLAITNIENAMRRKPSLLAYFIHVDVLRGQVLNSPDVEQARVIMDDVRVLKRQFPDNSRIRILSLGVHTVCYSVFGALKQPDLQQSARDEGLKDAAVLEKNELTPEMAMARWYFYDTIGEPERAVEGLQAAIGNAGDADAVSWYGSYLYRVGNIQESIKVLETLKGEVAIEFILLLALAEQPDDLAGARQLYEEIGSRPDLRDWDLLNQQLMLRFLGEKERAVALSRRILNEPEKFPSGMREAFIRSMEYCAEECSSEELITTLEGNNADECCAHFCIALTSLSIGDRAVARRHFKLCEATGQLDFVPYVASRMILSKMEHHEKWPGWIKPRL